jgi:spore maturation protein CgeB
MNSLAGKIFYRLADKRSMEWWTYQKQLDRVVNKYKPKAVIVTGILPLKHEIFESIHSYGGKIVNYLTDDPWNQIHYRKSFVQNIKHYDHIFSTKDALQLELRAEGCTSTSWLPFAYDPSLHKPVGASKETEVIFVGTGAEERLPWLNALNDLTGIKKQVYGNGWSKLSTPGWDQMQAVTGDDYCYVIEKAQIVLGLLRSANRDLSTDRSYEIGAIGGCGLYKDTIEHRKLLQGYPDAGFFNSPDDLRRAVINLLKYPDLQWRLREAGKHSICRPEHTYAARAKTILDWIEK